MTRYFITSYKHNEIHHVELTVTSQVQNNTMQITQINTDANLTTLMIKLMKLLVKHIHLKNTKSEPEDIKDPLDCNSPYSNLDSSSDSE